MHEEPKEARLIQPDAPEQKEAMQLWQRAETGMDGPQGLLPDYLVAYKLLDAAGEAMERGDW